MDKALDRKLKRTQHTCNSHCIVLSGQPPRHVERRAVTTPWGSGVSFHPITLRWWERLWDFLGSDEAGW